MKIRFANDSMQGLCSAGAVVASAAADRESMTVYRSVGPDGVVSFSDTAASVRRADRGACRRRCRCATRSSARINCTNSNSHCSKFSKRAAMRAQRTNSSSSSSNWTTCAPKRRCSDSASAKQRADDDRLLPAVCAAVLGSPRQRRRPYPDRSAATADGPTAAAEQPPPQQVSFRIEPH